MFIVAIEFKIESSIGPFFRELSRRRIGQGENIFSAFVLRRIGEQRTGRFLIEHEIVVAVKFKVRFYALEKNAFKCGTF